MSSNRGDVGDQNLGRQKHMELDVHVHDSETESHCLHDEVDALPDNLHFGWKGILWILTSIVFYLADVGLDVYASYVYYRAGYTFYFVLTLIFVIIPAGTMTAFSLRWYIMDLDNQTQACVGRPSCTKWVIRTLFLLLQLAPVLRDIDSLLYGLKCRKAGKDGNKRQQKIYYLLMSQEKSDAALLRLIEAFMEAAPQVTLQLYILIYYSKASDAPFRNSFQERMLYAGILSSLLSLAWSMLAYNRSIRFEDKDKPNISVEGAIFQFFWHFFIISSRVFALSVFAATYPYLLLPICIAHWLAMQVWLNIQGSYGCSNNCEAALTNAVVAFMYIFAFFNVRENQPTRYKYLTFYLICFLENTVLILTWFFSFNNVSTAEILIFRVCGLAGHYLFFILGIIFMGIYYSRYHPTKCQRNSKIPEEYHEPALSLPHRPKPDIFTRKLSVDQTAVHSVSSGGKKTVKFVSDEPKLSSRTQAQTSVPQTLNNSSNNTRKENGGTNDETKV